MIWKGRCSWYLFRPGCTYRVIIENWLREAGIVPYSMTEFGTLEGILGCVAAGMGVTLLPCSVVMDLNYISKVNAHKISD